jgi:hypothetical protein
MFNIYVLLYEFFNKELMLMVFKNNIKKGEIIMSKNNNDVYEIELQDGPVPFDPVIQSKIIASTDLSKIIINKILGELFKDYEGCSIIDKTSHDGVIRNISIFFKDKGNGEMVIIGKNNINTDNNIANRIMSLNAKLNTSKTYRLSDDVRNMLDPLIQKNRGAFNKSTPIDWNKVEVEIPETNQIGGTNIYIRVDNIDITAILKIFFGKKGDNGEIYDYNVSYVRALPNGVMLLKIDRVDKVAVDRLVHDAGISARGANNLNIDRSR